jgi:2-aminoadipate transaminase
MFDKKILAERTERMGSSAIREILKLISQPGMVSLAGGLPAPEAFPLEIIHNLTHRVLENYGVSAFQYDKTEGFGPLQEALAMHLKKSGIEVQASEICISSGSQGVLDALGKILIGPGDKIAVEAPTYLGAIQAFNPYNPQYISMETDDQGLIPESLEETLKNHDLKFVYLVPTFQNPTGRTIPLDRRKAIAEIIERYQVLLVEDDPYGALRYRGEVVPSIKSLCPQQVVYTSTFSKTFVPGIRTGFYLAPPFIQQWLIMAKQGVDLHTGTLNQALAAEYIRGGFIDEHVPEIIRLYKPRQEALLEAMDEFFPKDFHWTRPEGGMFIWVEGPRSIDIMKVYEEGIKRLVAFVPGRFFYTNPDDGLHTMRLNFTMSDEATLHSATKLIAESIEAAR